jgi:hypothetical protein
MAKEIHIGIGDSASTAKSFIDAWKRAEQGEKIENRATVELREPGDTASYS